MKKIIEKILGLFKNKNSGKERKSAIRPFRDWVLIFSLTVFGIVLVTAFGVYLLFLLQTGKFFGTVVGNTTKAGFEQGKLIETLDKYKKKQQEFDNGSSEKTTLVDPSI